MLDGGRDRLSCAPVDAGVGCAGGRDWPWSSCRSSNSGTARCRRYLPESVSLLSDSGMPLEQIARLLGHNGTAVTERVYRHQLRPVLEEGATAMDAIFPERPQP